MSAAAFFLLLSLRFLSPVNGQYEEPRLCDGVCYCSGTEAVVDCSPQDRIQGVPTNLPPGTRKLFIQGGAFPEPGHLSNKNLSGLQHLVSLRIVNSQLRFIESRAFLGMTSLRDLDLSMNQLQRLEPLTFYRLNLETLYLQEQRSQPDPYNIYRSHGEPEPLMLTNEAFSGLSAARIDLRRNYISDIAFAQFAKVSNLEKLILSSNKIREVDPKFADNFDKADRLLDLTDNPLLCSCQIAWLVNREKEWVLKTSTLRTSCLVDPRIGGPGSKVELRKIVPDHLCMASRIQTIGVDITPAGKAATLSCTAIAFNKVGADGGLDDFPYGDVQSFSNQPIVRLRPPSVAWKYVETGQLRQVTGMPSDLPQSLEQSLGSTETQTPMTTVQLNVSLSQANRKFTCITWDEKKNDQEVLVTIRGPATLPTVEVNGGKDDGISVVTNGKTPVGVDFNSKDAAAIKNAGNQGYPQSNFLFQKQYTLLEMIGAVLGTFLVTLIVLLVGSRCLVFLKHRAISNHMSKEIGGRLSSYDPGNPKQSDTPASGLNTTGRATCSTSNGHIQAATGYDGIAAYPIYNPYLATQASAVTYPAHLAPVTSLVTSPTTGQLMPISSATPLLQPMVPGLAPGSGQPLAYWPAPPGSAYSGAGSHEYDIPRAMDTSQFASEATTTLPRDPPAVSSLRQNHQPHPAISMPSDTEFSAFVDASTTPGIMSATTTTPTVNNM